MHPTSLCGNGAALLLLGGFLLSACKGKQDPDPCAKQQPTTADFVMYEELGYETNHGRVSRRYEVDTVAASGMEGVTFAARDTTALKYEWTFGNDPRVFTQRNVFLTFNQAYGPVAVKLRVTKQPNTACFPADNGTATAQKTLVVLTRQQAPLYGSYEGYNLSNPSRKFTVHLQFNSLLNMPEGSTYDLRNEVHMGSTALCLSSGTVDPPIGAAALTGFAALDRQNKRKLTFDYSCYDLRHPGPNWPIITDTFVGYRK